MNEFIVIIILIVSILQIILFFKIWNMTNDTAEIKRALNIILMRTFSERKRIKAMIEEVYKKLDKSNILISYESKEIVAEKIERGINDHKEFIEDMYEMHDIPNEYSYAQLKDELVSSFSKYIK